MSLQWLEMLWQSINETMYSGKTGQSWKDDPLCPTSTVLSAAVRQDNAAMQPEGKLIPDFGFGSIVSWS